MHRYTYHVNCYICIYIFYANAFRLGYLFVKLQEKIYNNSKVGWVKACLRADKHRQAERIQQN